jgi:hypothetical protein
MGEKRKELNKKKSKKRVTPFPPAISRRIRKLVITQLKSQGFKISGGNIVSIEDNSKDTLRRLHLAARTEKAYKELQTLGSMESELLSNFTDGSDIDPEQIEPVVSLVHTGTPDNYLYRYSTLLWSVPVSQGFGRRKRFLVRDNQNGKLIGIFAIGDPVFNLSCRDEYIGWSTTDRELRLYNIMDVFVLGAVPPYNQILGGKLVAYLAASNEVRNLIERIYHRKQTIIQKKYKKPDLALLTTSSALGKSSIYSRININGSSLYKRVGETKGWGHFHLNHGLFQELTKALEEYFPGYVALNRFGQGPNWKIRTASIALRKAGLSGELLCHGIKREVYIINISKNASEFLKGKNSRLKRRDLPQQDLVNYWKERWMRGRVERLPNFKKWSALEIPKLVRTGMDLNALSFKGKTGQEGM